MNIFILHENPTEAAKMHCDQHLGKMILESAQMLSTTIHKLTEANNLPPPEGIYKPTHRNHPCTLWCGESYANFLWVVDLVYSLQMQLPKTHKAKLVVNACEKLGKEIRHLFPSIYRTPFALAMPEDIKYNEAYPDTVSKYQELYRQKALAWRDKDYFMTYTQYGIRKYPSWLFKTLENIQYEYNRK